jgi:hypothetical protein
MAYFKGGYHGALGDAEDDDVVSRSLLRHDRGVQVRDALGYGRVEGQAPQPRQWKKLLGRHQELRGKRGMSGSDELLSTSHERGPGQRV